VSERKEITQVTAGERGLQLRSIEEMFRFAQYAVKSEIVPRGDTPEAVLIKIQAGAELGITPMRALQNLVVFNGRVSMMEKLANALVLGSGVLAADGQVEVWFTGQEFDDDYTCHVRSRRRDQNKSNETTFSVKDAKLARLWGKAQDRGVSPWVAFPKRMLAARAKQHHFQDHFGDVTLGTALSEAAMDDGVITVSGRTVRGGIAPTLVPSGPDPLFADNVETDAEACDDGGPVEVVP